jgi:predicted nucleotidyltransferase
MIDLDAEYAKTVKSLVRSRLPRAQIKVFGSRVSEGARSYSDLDIALVDQGKIPLAVMVALRDDFAESDLPFRVDVIDWHAITESFRAVIEKHHEVL